MWPLHVAFLCGLFWASAAWRLRSRGEHPKRAQWKGGRFHDLALEVAEALPSAPVRQLQRTTQVQRRGPQQGPLHGRSVGVTSQGEHA